MYVTRRHGCQCDDCLHSVLQPYLARVYGLQLISSRSLKAFMIAAIHPLALLGQLKLLKLILDEFLPSSLNTLCAPPSLQQPKPTTRETVAFTINGLRMNVEIALFAAHGCPNSLYPLGISDLKSFLIRLMHSLPCGKIRWAQTITR